MIKTRSKSPLRRPTNENASDNCVEPNRDQEVILLRKKLIQTHNKLLEQLDLTKHQEMRILELSRVSTDLGQHNLQQRSDLEALRTRVLAQMLEKNKARDDAKLLGQRLFQKEEELATIKDQLEASRHDQVLLEKRYEVMRQKFEQQSLELDKHSRSNETLRLEVSSSKVRCSELEQKIKQEQQQNRQVLQTNRQLTSRLSNLQTKLDDFEEQNLNLKNKFLLDSRQKSQLQTKTLQIEKLTAENNRLMTQLKERERQLNDVRLKTSHTPKKRDFDDTRQLIYKLEEAERETRARQSPYHHDNSNETVKQKLSSSRKQQRQITFEQSIYQQRRR